MRYVLPPLALKMACACPVPPPSQATGKSVDGELPEYTPTVPGKSLPAVVTCTWVSTGGVTVYHTVRPIAPHVVVSGSPDSSDAFDVDAFVTVGVPLTDRFVASAKG